MTILTVFKLNATGWTDYPNVSTIFKDNLVFDRCKEYEAFRTVANLCVLVQIKNEILTVAAVSYDESLIILLVPYSNFKTILLIFESFLPIIFDTFLCYFFIF